MARFRQRNILIDVIVVTLYMLAAAAVGAIVVHHIWSASARIYTDDYIAASDVPFLRPLDTALQEQATRYGWEYWHQASHVPLRAIHAIAPLILAAELRVAEGRAFHALVNGLLTAIEVYKGARGIKQVLFCADEVACRTPALEHDMSAEPSAAFIVDVVVAFAFAGYGLVQLVINAFASRLAAAALRREERAYPPAGTSETAGVTVLVPRDTDSTKPSGADLPLPIRHFLRDTSARRRQQGLLQPMPVAPRQQRQQNRLQRLLRPTSAAPQHRLQGPARPTPDAQQRRGQANGRSRLTFDVLGSGRALF